MNEEYAAVKSDGESEGSELEIKPPRRIQCSFCRFRRYASVLFLDRGRELQGFSAIRPFSQLTVA